MKTCYPPIFPAQAFFLFVSASRFRTGLFFSFIWVLILLQASPSLAGGTVGILYRQSNRTFAIAAAEMKKTLETAGYTVTLSDIGTLGTVTADNRVIITTRGTSETNSFLSKPGVSPLPPPAPEGYAVRKLAQGSSTDWYIIGEDKNGVLYGSSDFSKSVRLNGFTVTVDSEKKPFIPNRGIKFNIPLDSRTPSYSDNSDAAQQNIENMWDITFWRELLDKMAEDRFNMLSLWSLAPFPSLVDVPEYPKAGLQDVKRTTAPLSSFTTLTGPNMSNETVLANLKTVKTISLADKIKFWQAVMQYASDRGIDVYLFTWNTFTFGTENSGYGFTTAVTDAKTQDYFRKATKALLKTYPLLRGMGITAGENLKGTEADKEKFLYNSYGQGINDALAENPGRAFRLIHRAHQANISTIKSAFAGLNPRCSLEFSYKYSQAHVYSSVAPDYIHKDNFLSKIGDSKFFLTVRDDDWYYLRGGSDPAFVRDYLKNIPAQNFSGFYLGPDGYTWGREYLDKKPATPRQLVYDKRWYSFRLWGQLAYDPEVPDAYFANALGQRFPQVSAQQLQEAWAQGSQVIPLVNRFHNVGSQLDFQWYPEACFGNTGFHDISKFARTNPQSGEGLMSIPAYAEVVLAGASPNGLTPVEVSQKLQALGDQALELVSKMAGADKEAEQTLGDIRAMGYLGQYYAKKILGATNKYISDKTTNLTLKEKYKKEAIANLREAAESWRNYASQIRSTYISQWLTRMQQTVDITAIQEKVDRDVLIAGGPVNRVAVTGVSLNLPSASLEMGSTKQLTATVSPSSATNKNLRWSSSNSVVATVNGEGLVTALTEGRAVITVTTSDADKTATSTITVAGGKVAVVTEVKVEPGAVTLGPKGTHRLTATVSPTNALNKNVLWSSSNPAVATVSPSGVVTGVGAGTATITATSQEGGKAASSTVKVTGGGRAVEILGSWATGTSHPKKAGTNRALVVFVHGEHSGSLAVSSVRYGGQAMKPVVQKSQGTSTSSYVGAFILGEGAVAAATSGTIAVSWATPPSGGSQVTSVFLTNVNQAALTGAAAAGGSSGAATVSTAALSATTGDMVLLAATAAYDKTAYALNNGFAKGLAEQSPSWGDVVAGHKAGTGASETPSVSMPSSMRQAIVGLVVKSSSGSTGAIAVTGVKVSPSSASIKVNETLLLAATVSPADATNKSVTWTSSNPAVAKVSASGAVTGVGTGSVTITATTQDGNKTATSALTVSGDNNSAASILGSWVSGTSHPKKAGTNRALVVFVHGEHNGSLAVSSVRYGGQAMKPVVQKSQGTSTSSYVGAFILGESAIAAATSGTITVSWTTAPSGGSQVTSVFLANVNQAALTGASAAGGSSGAATVSTAALPAAAGDMVLLAATAAFNKPEYIPNNGFAKGLPEQSLSWGDVVAGHKAGTGASEIPSVTTSSSMRQGIVGLVVKGSGGTSSATVTQAMEAAEAGIRIYPNPVSHKRITVDFGSSVESGTIQIFDLSGRLLIRREFAETSSSHIDVGSISKGMYLVRVHTNQQTVTQQILRIE